MSEITGTMEFVTIGDSDEKHPVGDRECKECWDFYPKACVCGGLVHAIYGDEDDEGFWLDRKCDRCGDDWATPDGLI